jgi:putative SOS response-associated peptidase YedK
LKTKPDRPVETIDVCGRFTLRTNPQQLALHFSCEIPAELQPTYNVAPTQTVAALRAGAGGREFALLRWGLIPPWAKEKAIGNRLINARAETIAEKPAFRSAFRARRCLVLADGYFEWQKVGKTKQPFYFRMHDDAPFAMAGLWEAWKDPSQSDIVQTCTIITTDANELTQPIHDRMPAILSTDDYEIWLDPQQKNAQVLLPMLCPFDANAMTADLVSNWVNNPQHNDPRCIEATTSSNFLIL